MKIHNFLVIIVQKASKTWGVVGEWKDNWVEEIEERKCVLGVVYVIDKILESRDYDTALNEPECILDVFLADFAILLRYLAL